MKVYFIIIFVFFTEIIWAQDRNISLTQLDKAIELDGIIDESWLGLDSLTLNFQLEPNHGERPTRNTMVKVAQFNESLYFLFVCTIDSKNEISANIQQRDKLNLNDDLVSIMLDSYNDNHNAFLFQVNPLSTMADAKITNDGKSIDYLWDTEWEAKSSIHSDNWIAEIHIPLSSIRFNTKLTDWGCNFSRSFRANQEISWWQKMTENYRVSQGGQLSGLHLNPNKNHKLVVFPYATLRYENSDITGKHQEVSVDGGMDIQYKFSSNLNANIAVNPDFATVEGDKEQINLTPWELKFPEKRLFFQDGNEMFDTRIQTFYSRRIGDILLGGKVNGKIGKYQFNGLYVNTNRDEQTEIPSAHFNAFRLKRDFLKASTLGLTYTNKITDTLTFHTFSADYTLNLGQDWKLTGQFVGSTPGDLLSHSAWFLRFAKENNTYHYHIRYTELGKNFKSNVNETGFIRDDDRKEIDSDINYKFWFENFANYLKLSGKNNVFWSQRGTLRSWYLTYGGRIYLRNKVSLDLYYNNEYKDSYRLVPDDYYNHYYRAVLGYNTDENNFVEISYRSGENFKRNFDLLELNSRVQFLKKFSISYEFKFLSFNPDPSSEKTMLNILGLSYYQTKDLWFRIFTQHNSNNDRIYLYGLSGWRFKPPFGALYLIFSSDKYQDLLQQEQINSNILFLKLTYPINVIK